MREAFQHVKANHDFVSTEQELTVKTGLTRKIAELTAKIEQLTTEIHTEVVKSK